jgi:hypothetical protein
LKIVPFCRFDRIIILSLTVKNPQLALLALRLPVWAL